VFSARSLALDGVSWAQGGEVENAVGWVGRVRQNRRRRLLPPSGVAPCGSSMRSPISVALVYAATNSVPFRSIACMMIARRRARATLALRIVDRLAIAKAQSFSLSWPL
jgi:hypothetical protein